MDGFDDGAVEEARAGGDYWRGSARLVLAHSLAEPGVEAVVLEDRSRGVHRAPGVRRPAGVPTVELLREHGLGERMLREAKPHRGTESRRIPYSDVLAGRAMLVYPQQEMVADLVRLRLDQGGSIVFEVDDVRLHDLDSERPAMSSSFVLSTETMPSSSPGMIAEPMGLTVSVPAMTPTSKHGNGREQDQDGRPHDGDSSMGNFPHLRCRARSS